MNPVEELLCQKLIWSTCITFIEKNYSKLYIMGYLSVTILNTMISATFYEAYDKYYS